MNYYSENNKELKEAVASLLSISTAAFRRVNFGVSYSQNRKMSMVTIEVYPSSTLQGIILVYTRGLKLYDALTYRSKRFFRISQHRKSLQHLDRITQYLSERIPQFNPVSPRKIDEESDEKDKLEKKDQQIQQLKDRNRIEKDVSRSLRNQMRVLRARD
jgi:hypothetical protein